MCIAWLLSQTSHRVPGKLKITEYFFQVPRDYSKPGSESLRLFARSAEKIEAAERAKDEEKQLPWLLYLQGGPGMPCRPPQHHSWVDPFLDKGYKVLLLDQRGTGLSSTVTAEGLAKLGGPAEQADYLKHFRADSIVQDAEAIRKYLTGSYPENKKKWSVLGQSFGGFCAIHYISRFPEGLREVFTTAGLPPLVKQPFELYKKLFKRVIVRNKKYYEKYPEDEQRVKDLVGHLTKNDVRSYSGGKVTVARLRSLGMNFGFHGTLDDVHNLVLRMTNDIDMLGCLSRPTIQAFDSQGPFDTAILYAMLHEAIYCEGEASNWSADRAMRCTPEFAAHQPDSPVPIFFSAEMILKSMFDDYSELQTVRETANLLASYKDWPQLYDEEQLARNEVPVYSANFYDDLFVDFDYAQETASKIKGCKVFVTNTMYHNALGPKSDELIKELFKLRDDAMD